MNIGIVKEEHTFEGRVAITPANAKALIQAGHRVFVEAGAGLISRFSDEDYRSVGAEVVYTQDEVFGRADLVCKVAPPSAKQYEMMRHEQIVMCPFHLAVARKNWVEMLIAKKVTAIGMEIIEEDDGSLPVVIPMSEIAGQLSIQVASQYLQSQYGGRGILLGGLPGVPPAIVVILGAGVVGTSAAVAATSLGAQVILLDHNINRLRHLRHMLHRRVTTAISNEYNIEKAVKFADVLIGAVLVPGERAPVLVTREMVKTMRPKSLIIDVSIDQGGCVETSRPTTVLDPIFIEENVIHYCVPNMPTKVARTATYALSNATLPYIRQIADLGIHEAMRRNRAIARGTYTYRGYCLRSHLAEGFGVPYRDVRELLKDHE